MSRDSHPPKEKPQKTGRRVPWGSLALMGLVLTGFAIWLSPVNSFHPTCTYTVNARVSADVEISGQKLSSEVVHQNSRSRRWISVINSAGCKQRYGTALVYKAADDSVLIVSARLCYAAEKAIARSGYVDILRTCSGRRAKQNKAFIVDSATRPRKWRMATNGVDFQIIRMTATSTWSNPTDEIASIAPGLLSSRFEYGRRVSIPWSKSPETLISYGRRYDVKRQRPDNSFEFKVQYGDF